MINYFLLLKVDRNVLVAAIESDFFDFEDAVLYQAGVHVDVDGFVTRNVKDFNLAEHPIYTPSGLSGITQSNSG